LLFFKVRRVAAADQNIFPGLNLLPKRDLHLSRAFRLSHVMGEKKIVLRLLDYPAKLRRGQRRQEDGSVAEKKKVDFCFHFSFSFLKLPIFSQ
jgi:hypothetical protein